MQQEISDNKASRNASSDTTAARAANSTQPPYLDSDQSLAEKKHEYTVNAITIMMAFLLVSSLLINDPIVYKSILTLVLGLMLFAGYRCNTNRNKVKTIKDASPIETAQGSPARSHATAKVTFNLPLQHSIMNNDTSLRDQLTGLLNRQGLERALQELINDAGKNGSHHVMCYLDLDSFKIINDTCGYVAGDEFLRQLTPILLANVRDNDIVGRWGNDEFIILFPHSENHNAYSIVDRLRKSVEDIRFSWSHSSYAIGVSIGMLSFSRSSVDISELIKAADYACQNAKMMGGNRIYFHEHDANTSVLQIKQAQWVNRITDALDDNRFRLYFQPIDTSHTASPGARHYEVIVRMVNPQGHLIPPLAFMPAAKRYRLMTKIDKWVVSNSINALKILSQQQPTIISINLATESITDPLFLDYILDRIENSNIDTQSLHFEISETNSAVTQLSSMHMIKQLRKLGCKIVLDNFGSGFSSFNHLKNLPIDYIKIDGSLIQNMAEDDSHYTIIEMIQKICRAMNKETIAGHVENKQTLDMLRRIGIDYYQGYYLSKPMPLEEIMQSENKPLLRLV